MLKRFLTKQKHREAAHDLYLAVVAQARQPVFYRDMGVADTLDGRFDLITLHAFLVVNRLKQIREESRAADDLSQALFDIMFADMDRSLREMGVGDLSVGKRVKAMARAFFGRVSAYESGLDAAGDALEQALARNLYRGNAVDPEALRVMADYVRKEFQALKSIPAPDLMAGRVAFTELTAAN
jgi:cytochrome b pre-mRNA-processing protein 3